MNERTNLDALLLNLVFYAVSHGNVNFEKTDKYDKFLREMLSRLTKTFTRQARRMPAMRGFSAEASFDLSGTFSVSEEGRRNGQEVRYQVLR